MRRLTQEEATKLFLSRFDRSGGPDACHPWTGAIDNGYGQFSAVALGGKQRAHTFLWELENGPIPVHEGTGRKLDLDHECHNHDLSCPGGERCLHRRCGNLSHIVVKTPKENLDAADEPRARGRFRESFDCGHPTSEENTYLIKRKGTRGGKPRVPERRCRKCTREKQAYQGRGAVPE